MSVAAYALPNDPPHLKIAFANLGLRETPGPGSNPRIVAMYAISGNRGVKDDAVAWCSAFANYCIVKGGSPGTNSLAARSWLAWGKARDPANAVRGDVLVFRRGSSTWQGHVCFFLGREGLRLVVIGGNQGDSVSVARLSAGALIGVRYAETVANSVTVKTGVAAVAAEGGSRALTSVASFAEGAPEIPTGDLGGLGELMPYLQQAAPYLKYAAIALSLIAVGTLAYTAYRFIQKRLRPTPVPIIPPGETIPDDGDFDRKGPTQ